MRAHLRALEKNILKYRALQMVLLLHQTESLRSFLIGSIRYTDFIKNENRLPINVRGAMEKALNIIVKDGIISSTDRDDLQSIIAMRNTIAHRIHELVVDISASDGLSCCDSLYDYFALERFERYRHKISSGMTRNYALQIGLRELQFGLAEAAYKEELSRLRQRIDRQHGARNASL
ncbi:MULTISPECIES: hypothetical protein [Xanthomonas]|uniref:hypothetical protein n=1 Tax=Xanthomonas TaxID=338 RepID=UPI000E1F7426|nr:MULTISPECIES: hypothetical protein [Xanthomonas]